MANSEHKMVTEVRKLVEDMSADIARHTNGTFKVTTEEEKDDIFNEIDEYEYDTVEVTESVGFLIGRVASEEITEEGERVYEIKPCLTIQRRDADGMLMLERDIEPDSTQNIEDFVHDLMTLLGEPRPFDPFVPIRDYGVEPSEEMVIHEVEIAVAGKVLVEMEVPANFNEEQVRLYLEDRIKTINTPVVKPISSESKLISSHNME